MSGTTIIAQISMSLTHLFIWIQNLLTIIVLAKHTNARFFLS